MCDGDDLKNYERISCDTAWIMNTSNRLSSLSYRHCIAARVLWVILCDDSVY